MEVDEESDVDSDTMEIYNTIQKKKKIMKERSEFNKVANHPKKPRNKLVIDKNKLIDDLDEKNIETEGVMKRGKKRTRSIVRKTDEEMQKEVTHHRKEKDDGLPDDYTRQKVKKMKIRALLPFAKEGRAGESDRKIGDKMPKHLNSGKRGVGKTDRR